MPRICVQPARLYAIADAERLGPEPGAFSDSVRALVDGGVRLLQLRLKPLDRDQVGDDAWRYRIVERTLEALHDVLDSLQLWIDDRADLAACFARVFAGVHVGQQDLPPRAVQAVLGGSGSRALVGLSCHDVSQVRVAEADADVDWIAIGPVFGTRSKANPDPVVGLDGVCAARAATSKPLVAIGGLDAERIPAVLASGADSAVVLGALSAEGRDPASVSRMARRLVRSAEDERRPT